MAAELMWSSWETIAHRTWMMARGRCSPAEYRRMVSEKALVAYLSGAALISKRGRAAAALAPWHRRATANANRLRRKR
jgi:hypothetical protein